MNIRNLKDKRIEKAGMAYVAIIHMYDGQRIHLGRHATLRAAQGALAKYPNDIFEGYDDPNDERAVAVMDRARWERTHQGGGVAYHRKRTPNYERLYERRIL